LLASNTGAPERPPASSPCGSPLHGVAGQGGVGGDHGVDVVFDEGVANVVELFGVQVGGDFEGQRNIAPMLVGQAVLGVFEPGEQGVERVFGLQLP